MPIRLAHAGPSVLAVGGELKSTFCVTKENYAYMSQHIGDVGNVETLHALQRSVEHFLTLFRVDVEAVVADLHPDYLSSQWARQLSERIDAPLISVQHHFAHAASLIAEQGWGDDRSIIACCFDGTGYGTDGAIWGGEFLIANGNGFDRAAQLEYFKLPGGDASIKRPYRTALSLLGKHQHPWDERLPCVAFCPTNERRVLQQQLDKNINCARTSSMGRLFDAVAALIGVRREVSYEAQAAMEMEAIASEAIDTVGPRDRAAKRRWYRVGASNHRSKQADRYKLITTRRPLASGIILDCWRLSPDRLGCGHSASSSSWRVLFD